jgi:hypothetical protein
VDTRTVEASKLEAFLDDGVLTVRAPSKQPATPRVIPVSGVIDKDAAVINHGIGSAAPSKCAFEAIQEKKQKVEDLDDDNSVPPLDPADDENGGDDSLPFPKTPTVEPNSVHLLFDIAKKIAEEGEKRAEAAGHETTPEEDKDYVHIDQQDPKKECNREESNADSNDQSVSHENKQQQEKENLEDEKTGSENMSQTSSNSRRPSSEKALRLLFLKLLQMMTMTKCRMGAIGLT